MKVISLIQPWATLIALGEKQVETRSWKTNHRGELAIHASKKIDRLAWNVPPIVQALRKHGINHVGELPTGKILATCCLDDCLEIVQDKGDSAILGNTFMIIGDEYWFGFYQKGRFAWKLSNIQTLDEPIPIRGHLGLWNYQQ